MSGCVHTNGPPFFLGLPHNFEIGLGQFFQTNDLSELSMAHAACPPFSWASSEFEPFHHVGHIDRFHVGFHQRSQCRPFAGTDLPLRHGTHDSPHGLHGIVGEFHLWQVDFNRPIPRQSSTEQKFEHWDVTAQGDFDRSAQ